MKKLNCRSASFVIYMHEFGAIIMNILQVQCLRKLQEAVLYFCTIEKFQSYNSWKS